MPDIPRSVLELLGKNYVRSTSSVRQCQTSADGQTSKLLIRLQDGLECESVIMQYDTTGKWLPWSHVRPVCGTTDGLRLAGITQGQAHGRRRATLCVSSQVGCQMGCTFCATGASRPAGTVSAGAASS